MRRVVQYVTAELHFNVRIYSGPVLALALARMGAVHHWRNILGPSDVDKAREESPEWWVVCGSIHLQI